MFKKFKENSNGLWTRNYKILMAGSLVSDAGTVIVDAVFGLMLLDLSESGMLYSLLLIIGNATGIIVPLLMGSRVEKKRKEKVIYSLDFISGGIFILMGFISMTNVISAELILGATLIYEAISSVYALAYDGLFPAIVKQENYARAYSVGSVMENLCESAGLLGVFGYNLFGAVPVLFFCGACYLVAAIFETRIKLSKGTAMAEKAVIDEGLGIKAFFNNYRDVFSVVNKTAGFREIVTCYLADSLRTGVLWAMILPYLELKYEYTSIFGFSLDRDYVYMIVLAFYSIGQFWSGVFNYRLNMHGKRRYTILIISSLVETISLSLVLVLPMLGSIIMMAAGGAASILSLCTYDTGIVERVPEEMRTRFSGVLESSSAGALIIGNFLGGLMIDHFTHAKIGIFLGGVPEIIMMLLLIFVFRDRVRTFFDTGIEEEKDI